MERESSYAHECVASRGLPGDAERMSGVLDGMVQQSRGSLPAIEPLVRAQQTAAAALSIVADENATTVSRGRNAALAGGARALRDESTRLVRDDVRRDAAQDRDATRMDSRRSQALKAAGVNRASEGDGTVAANGADQDGGAQLERAAELRDAAPASDEPNESSMKMRAEQVPAKPEESIRTRASVGGRGCNAGHTCGTR